MTGQLVLHSIIKFWFPMHFNCVKMYNFIFILQTYFSDSDDNIQF
jgi:hypothetical protein